METWVFCVCESKSEQDMTSTLRETPQYPEERAKDQGSPKPHGASPRWWCSIVRLLLLWAEEQWADWNALIPGWIFMAGFSQLDLHRFLLGAGTQHGGLFSASTKHSSPSLVLPPHWQGLLTHWQGSLAMDDRKIPQPGVRIRLNTSFLLSFQTLHMILYTSQFELALWPIWIFHVHERQTKQ